MIPTILHSIWIGSEMPDWAEDNLRLFRELNPEFAIQRHGEAVLLPCLTPAYESISGEHVYSRRSDLLRVSALIRYGGWYLDADFLPIRSMSEIYRDFGGFPRNCFVTHGDNVAEAHDPFGKKSRRWIANGVIGSTSDSPFLSMVFRGIVMAHQRGESGWDVFGPMLFTRIAETAPGTVHIGHMDDFYRINNRDDSMTAYRMIRDANYSREAIARWVGEPLPYMLHMGMQDEVEL